MSMNPTPTIPASTPPTGRANKLSLPTIIAVTVVIAISLGLLALTARSQATDRDFISYWAGAKLLVTHGNPYDAASVLPLENGAGNHYTRPLVMRNTPATMFLMAPLGWFSVWTAATIWEAALIVAALLSIGLLQPFTSGKIPFIAYCFAPIVDCFLAGQTTIFVLLGVCLFIRFQERRPFYAGAALLLTLLKPHLLFLFWPILLLEIVRRRQGKVIAGGVVAVLAASAVSTAIDPRIWAQYLASVRAEHIEMQYFPNLAVALRILIAPSHLWPQLLPAALGIVVAIALWARSRAHWEWHRQGALLIAASALVAPYSFLVDQVLFLPAVLFCYPRANNLVRIIFLLINAAAFVLMLRVPEMSSPVTIWVAPAMMLWCWWVYQHQKVDVAPPRAA
ncbi:MAG: glycosyltransferase 87 family protein [Acidobacteriaceae bacterium]